MAKKIIPDENSTEEKETPITDNLPTYVIEILKSFNGYEILYVDEQGGMYTANTPKQVRGKAILYKNPYYKS